MSEQRRPSVEELFELLRRTSLPTVLVEGKNDIIFYRKVEEDLKDIGIDMLPAGNKGAVLELQKLLSQTPISAPVAYIVDNDIWVHTGKPDFPGAQELITTVGYSVENDLFCDGSLIDLLDGAEYETFLSEVEKFAFWYSLAIDRTLRATATGFRTHPGKVLDDPIFFAESTILSDGETFPHELQDEICKSYDRVLRGKSLFAILARQLSRSKRAVKFGEKQLMAIGASRKGPNFERIRDLVRTKFETV